jgi:metallo-beta-lactamase family protein
MSKNKKDKIKISFIGGNSDSVTGSMILIETLDKKIILEAGLFQCGSIRDAYEINSRRFKFKPSQIDYIFLNHNHIDHSGLLPRLYKEGCNARIITPIHATKFLSILLRDSCRIINSDIEVLNKKSNKALTPLYSIEDVENTLEHIEECEFNNTYNLDDNMAFEFIPAGHIINSAQLVLYITQNNHTQKLLYTSDLGNIKLSKIKPFVDKFEKVNKVNIAIVESTYSNRDKSVKMKDYEKDLEKMKSVIMETCVERKGRVLIPSFAMDRSQFILKILYDLFGSDVNFDIPIIIDSPMTCDIFDVYGEILEGEDKELFDKIISWKNVKFVRDSDESRALINDKQPKVIISSSGMMTKGRSKNYCKSILPDSNACILFAGYSSEGSLAWKIKNGKEQKTITIDNKPYKNKCNIVSLNSFSSHIQRDDMIAYYSQINCDKICLVHGNMDGKISLKQDLDDKFSKENKTTKVIVVNKDTIANL